MVAWIRSAIFVWLHTLFPIALGQLQQITLGGVSHKLGVDWRENALVLLSADNSEVTTISLSLSMFSPSNDSCGRAQESTHTALSAAARPSHHSPCAMIVGISSRSCSYTEATPTHVNVFNPVRNAACHWRGYWNSHCVMTKDCGPRADVKRAQQCSIPVSKFPFGFSAGLKHPNP